MWIRSVTIKWTYSLLLIANIDEGISRINTINAIKGENTKSQRAKPLQFSLIEYSPEPFQISMKMKAQIQWKLNCEEVLFTANSRIRDPRGKVNLSKSQTPYYLSTEYNIYLKQPSHPNNGCLLLSRLIQEI